jgi:hypothetical protein
LAPSSRALALSGAVAATELTSNPPAHASSRARVDNRGIASFLLDRQRRSTP